MPEISVLFPVYNEKPANLAAALDSLLAQTFSDFELLVLDDSTNSETIALIEQYAAREPRIRVIRRTSGRGLASALNGGVRVARGNFLARVDSDDIQEPFRLAMQHAYLQAHPAVGVVGSWVNLIDVGGRPLGVYAYRESHAEIRRVSCIRNPMSHPTVMLRRSVLDQHGEYDETFTAAEDYELWLRLLARGVVFANVASPCVRFRIADISRRSNNNWHQNMRAKLRYLSWDHLPHRLVGIGIVGLFWALPNSVKSILYRAVSSANA